MFVKKFRIPFQRVLLFESQNYRQKIVRHRILNMCSGSKFKVLLTRSDFPDSGVNILKEKCDLEIWDISKGIIPKDEMLKRIKGKNALFFRIYDKVDAEIIRAGTELKVIATMSDGVDHIDLAAAKAAGIKVGHTPQVVTEATSELTIALLLATSRRLFEANHALKTGGWKSWSPVWMCGLGLDGATCGIFGYGKIGKSTARKLKTFQVQHILYTGPKQTKEEEDGVEYCEIDEFLSRSDVVIVSCPLMDETRKFFTYEKFCRMKPTAVFINASRANVIDQEGLMKALKDKKIAYAGLDVTVPEPLPADHSLFTMENVVITPHLGACTARARSNMCLLAGQNIMAALEGRPMPAEYAH